MKRFIIVLSIILFFISTTIIFIFGRHTSFDYEINNTNNISIKCDEDIIKCNYKIKNNKIHFEIDPVKPGVGTVKIKDNDSKEVINKLIYVHKFGIITLGNFFGYCIGDISFIISFYIIFMLVLIHLFKEYIINKKNNLYSYKNSRLLGLIIYLSIIYFIHLFFFIYDLKANYYNSVMNLLTFLQNDITLFMFIIFPFFIIITILVTISNFILLKKEGKKWTNLLGLLLGGFICVATLISFIAKIFAINSVIYTYFYSLLVSFVVYLQCILLGVSILAIKAAKMIPKFDKDAIIILGCQIRKDGSLPPLLKSRVDRAIEFSIMQKNNTGKDIIFIPSGGQGSDEIMSEAQAMKNYLLKQGINNNSILIEDKSTSTYENIKYSYKIINNKIKDPKVVISTNNYHVFRAGIIASNQKIKVECIGAKTKSYYWINAFIREFIATLISEKKSHIRTLIELMIIILLFVIAISVK